MKALMCAVLLAGALAACGHSRGETGGSGSGDPTGTNTMTSFVIDLVVNHTKDAAMAVSSDTFASLPDPDGDRNNVSAYRSLF